jgi:hypothetical protein
MSHASPVLVACALVALLLPTAARSQSAQPVTATPGGVYVFETVDSYDVQGLYPRVTVQGVQQGQAAASSVTFGYSIYSGSTADHPRSFERCERLALLAMNKPGQYLLEVRQEAFGSQLHVGCRLTRR